ncbi:FecR domain-containing protein [Bdellovibrio sp. HCB290]|uniref:FecR domain-containing protein n=1 Tax=Bdellovibrio sp. HCB290 TaxID=3394356 RepID=UPI0039B504EF
MSRLGKTEKTIFTVAVIALLLFSYFLYDDSLLFPKNGNSQMDLIGSVATSQNDVRRKNLDTFSWLPANREDQIFDNDSIYTGERSEAQIRLQDGTVIRISPNSLITLNMKNGQMMLDLRYGNLVGDINKGTALKIKSGEKEFNLDGSGKIEFKKSHSGNVDLRLLSGNLNYQDKKERKILEKSQPVAVSQQGMKPLVKPTVELLTANNSVFVRENPDEAMAFAWRGQGNIAHFEMEVSPTANFDHVAVLKDTKEGKTDVVEPLEPGPYFWRVKAYDKNGTVGFSEVRQMTLAHLDVPVITTPVSDARFQMEVETDDPALLSISTEVRWTAGPLLKTYHWQVSRDEQFTAIVKEGNSAMQNILTPRLASGTYWVRVSGSTIDKKNSAWSASVPFTVQVTAKKEPVPERPELIAKDIKFRLPRPEERRPASEMAPKLEWKPVSKTRGYRVQVSKDLSFQAPQTYDVPDTATMWSQVEKGQHYYRVYAISPKGQLSPPSDIGNIAVEDMRPILTVPQLMEPFNNMSIFLQTQQEPFIWLEWKKVAGATGYTVEVSNTEDFSKILYTSTLQNNRFLIKSKIPLGKIYWRVRAEAQGDTPSDWANKREFTVYHQKNETFVK